MDPERELALLISHRRPNVGNERGYMDLARGVISGLLATQPGFVSVKIDGGNTPVKCETLSSYNPTIGDVVEILALGDRVVIIGRIGVALGPLGEREHRGWAISGTLIVQSGANGYIPPIFVTVPADGLLQLYEILGVVRAGTVTVTVNQYSWTGTLKHTVSINLTTTRAKGFPSGFKCADGDYFDMVISSPSGADGLALTLAFEKS
jgi:hypothetical protein